MAAVAKRTFGEIHCVSQLLLFVDQEILITVIHALVISWLD